MTLGTLVLSSSSLPCGAPGGHGQWAKALPSWGGGETEASPSHVASHSLAARGEGVCLDWEPRAGRSLGVAFRCLFRAQCAGHSALQSASLGLPTACSWGGLGVRRGVGLLDRG